MRTHHWFPTVMIALVGAFLFYWIKSPTCMADSVVLESRSVRGALVSLITVDLNDATMKVGIGLPARGISHAETFGSFINRNNPLAAVTGTYFDTRTYVPTGSIVVGGKLVHESNIGTAVCFTSGNKVRFISAKRGEACDLSGAECAVRTGPRLLAGGAYALNPRPEGFRHPGLYGARTRMVLGVTANNKLLLVSVRTPVTFGRAASIMRTLGAMDAVCLDGGTSSAMYFKGRIVRQPGRLLTNLIEVRRRSISDMPVQIVASADGAVSAPEYWMSQCRTTDRTVLLADREPHAVRLDQPYQQVALLSEPLRLRLSKGIHALFPIDRAKLTCL